MVLDLGGMDVEKSIWKKILFHTILLTHNSSYLLRNYNIFREFILFLICLVRNLNQYRIKIKTFRSLFVIKILLYLTWISSILCIQYITDIHTMTLSSLLFVARKEVETF